MLALVCGIDSTPDKAQTAKYVINEKDFGKCV